MEKRDKGKLKAEIPVKALQDIVEWCKAEDPDSPSTKLIELLNLMVKYEDFFFSKSWPEKLDNETNAFPDSADLDFIEKGGPEELKPERVFAATLRSHISHEGFSYLVFYFGLCSISDCFLRLFQ